MLTAGFVQVTYEHNFQRRSQPDFPAGSFHRDVHLFSGLVCRCVRILCDERFPERLVGDAIILDADSHGDSGDLLYGRHNFGGCTQALALLSTRMVRVGGRRPPCHPRYFARVLGGQGVIFNEWGGDLNRSGMKPKIILWIGVVALGALVFVWVCPPWITRRRDIHSGLRQPLTASSLFRHFRDSQRSVC